MLCLFTPSIECVYAFPVLSYFVLVHAKYWLCICVARLELFCVWSRQVLIVYMCYPSWVILCLFTPSIDWVYALPVLSYFVFVHAKYWLCIYVARLELFCVCARQVLIMYMCCPSWVILCLFTPSIDYVFALPVLSYFVFVHAKYWLYICVARLELFCVCSRQVLIVYMCCPSWGMLCLFTSSIDCVYVLPVLSYFVFAHAKYWLCTCVARLELFCVCSRLVLIVYLRCPSRGMLCLFTSSIDCVYALPVLSYFVFVHAKYWLCICVARLFVIVHA